MNQTNWLKQTVDSPLYDNLIWSRPENKLLAGRVLVIGGNVHGFSKTVSYYDSLLKAGVGSVKILLPKSIGKLIGNISEDVIFCPDTDSGSFGPESYGDMVEYSNICDSIFFPGELTNNSQTLIVIEKIITNTTKPIILGDDSIDLSLNLGVEILSRRNMIFIGDLGRIQKLFMKFKTDKAITHDLALINLVEILQDFSYKYSLSIVTSHLGNIVVASGGLVSTTKINGSEELIKVTPDSACWATQNQANLFEALSCSAITYQQ